MGMLDSLLGGMGQGLRAGSGVLNEQVFQNNEALRQKQMQDAEARKAQMFKYVWEGIQGGAIDPQKGLQAMAQIDPRATEQMLGALGQGGIGPGIAAQDARAKQERALFEQRAADAAAAQLGGIPGEPPTLTAQRLKAQTPKVQAPLAEERLITAEAEARASGDINRANSLAAIIRKKGHIAPPASMRVYLPPTEKAWATDSGKTDSKFREADMLAGQAAMEAEGTLLQLGDLLSQGGTATGSLQPFVTQVQGIAEDLGVDTSGISKRLGIKSGGLANKEQFNSLAANLVITISSKFKGALNGKELQALKDSQADLGKSEEGNRLALASALAAARVAQERGAASAQTSDHNAYRKSFAERSRGGAEQLEAYRKEYLERLGGTAQPSAGPEKKRVVDW